MALTLQELSDREEIREAIHRWSRAVDTKDWALLATCYTDDIVADFTAIGIPDTSGPGVQKFLEDGSEDFTAMQHVLSNITFHELRQDFARTSTQVHATVVPREGTLYRLGVWYHDELRHTAEGWKVSKRLAELVFWDGDPGT